MTNTNNSRDKGRTPKGTILVMAAAMLLTTLTLQADAATFTVTSNADAGAGTLRDAINNANATAGFDTIQFSGVTSIALTTPLPAITDPVMIDGGTAPVVELNGEATQGAGIASIGLWIRAGGVSIRGLIINRFGEAGIRLDSDGIGIDDGNTITASVIGADGAVTTALPNINRGILIVGTTGHNIGGGNIADRNFISGNAGRGIEITAGGSATIRGNYIGVTGGGTGDLGNTQHGIQIVNSSNSVVGGTNNGVTDRNVISGNNGNGVMIIADFGSPATNNSVLGNYIGVTAAGSTALPNNGSGVVVQAQNNTIGSDLGGGGRNVISGNAVNGISIGSNFGTGNLVMGNYVGLGADGTTTVPNNDNGIQISNLAAANTVGGGVNVTPGMCNGSCNVITGNGGAGSTSARAGVYLDITAGIGNAIVGNSIYSNGNPTGLGIDLAVPGSTANDAGDGDGGPNNTQNRPTITTANTAEAINGTLSSTPNSTFQIDFYVNPAGDGANSEGRTFIGTLANVVTDGAGNAAFTYTSPVQLTAGQLITATATSLGLFTDTSEFSDPTAVLVSTASTVSVSGRVVDSSGGGIRNVIVSFTSQSGITRYARTNGFGRFMFSDVEVGLTYTVTASQKRHQFPVQLVTVNDTISELEIVASP